MSRTDVLTTENQGAPIMRQMGIDEDMVRMAHQSKIMIMTIMAIRISILTTKKVDTITIGKKDVVVPHMLLLEE